LGERRRAADRERRRGAPPVKARAPPCCTSPGEGESAGRGWKRMGRTEEGRRGKWERMTRGTIASVCFFEIMRLYYSETRLQSLIAFSSKDAGKASFHKHFGIDNGSNFTQ
jgi:hypothetical protein